MSGGGFGQGAYGMRGSGQQPSPFGGGQPMANWGGGAVQMTPEMLAAREARYPGMASQQPTPSSVAPGMPQPWQTTFGMGPQMRQTPPILTAPQGNQWAQMTQPLAPGTPMNNAGQGDVAAMQARMAAAPQSGANNPQTQAAMAQLMAIMQRQQGRRVPTGATGGLLAPTQLPPSSSY